MTRCEPFASEPLRKKVIRVDVCQSQSLICSDGGNGLKCNDESNFPLSLDEIVFLLSVLQRFSSTPKNREETFPKPFGRGARRFVSKQRKFLRKKCFFSFSSACRITPKSLTTRVTVIRIGSNRREFRRRSSSTKKRRETPSLSSRRAKKPSNELWCRFLFENLFHFVT